MRVLVACEFSGAVRDAFLRRGHDAWSCDLLPSESPIPDRHFQTDVLGAIRDTGPASWDLIIAHPPCTYLANSGAKHLYVGAKLENGPDPIRWGNMRAGAAFFLEFWNLPVPRLCIENPVMVGHAQKIIGAKMSQSIQPWQFGHGSATAGTYDLAWAESMEGKIEDATRYS